MANKTEYRQSKIIFFSLSHDVYRISICFHYMEFNKSFYILSWITEINMIIFNFFLCTHSPDIGGGSNQKGLEYGRNVPIGRDDAMSNVSSLIIFTAVAVHVSLLLTLASSSLRRLIHQFQNWVKQELFSSGM